MKQNGRPSVWRGGRILGAGKAVSMKAGTLENKKEKTPPVGYSIPMLMRHYCGLAQPASPIVCADSGLRAIPGVNQVMP